MPRAPRRTACARRCSTFCRRASRAPVSWMPTREPGAVGIEALSRGAAHAWFLERDRRALDAIRKNLASLGAERRATVLAGKVLVDAGALSAGHCVPGSALRSGGRIRGRAGVARREAAGADDRAALGAPQTEGRVRRTASDADGEARRQRAELLHGLRRLGPAAPAVRISGKPEERLFPMPKRKTKPASKPARKTAKRAPKKKPPVRKPPAATNPNPPPKPSPLTFPLFRPNRSPLSKSGSALPAYWTSSLATSISPPEPRTSKSSATRRPYRSCTPPLP